MSALQMMLDWVRGSGVFQRNRVPLEVKVLSGMLCFSGLSYRRASRLVSGLSYVAVRDAFIALRRALPKPKRRVRRLIAVDETKAKLGGEQVFIWVARDVDTKEVLTFRASFTRSSLDAEMFLKQVLDAVISCFFKFSRDQKFF